MAHKLRLMAQSPKTHETLGRLVVSAKGMAPDDVEITCERGTLQGLKMIATNRRNANVLQHIPSTLRPGPRESGRQETEPGL